MAAPELLLTRSLHTRARAEGDVRRLRREAGGRALGASGQRLHPAVRGHGAGHGGGDAGGRCGPAHREHDTRLWQVIHHYVDAAREEISHALVCRVGVDETSLRRGHNYLTLFVDLDGAQVLFATEGREAETFGLFRDDLEAHGGTPDRIRELCMDMSPAYRKGAREHLPNALTTFDRFHVVKLLNEAVDQVRRAERKDAPELKRTRYLWLKNQSNLSSHQQRRLEQLVLAGSHLKTVQAYQMKLAFQDFWELSAAHAGRFLDAWCAWVRDSDLPPMKRFAETVRNHRLGILRWFHTRISNGLLEGLSSLVQAAKARARGYRSTKNLTAMIYLMHGKPPLSQPPFELKQ